MQPASQEDLGMTCASSPRMRTDLFQGQAVLVLILRYLRAASLKNSSFICTTSKDRKQTPSTSTTCVCCEACYGRRHLLNSKCHCHHYYESSRRSRHSKCTLNHIIASCCFALGSKLRILRRSLENQPQQNLPETSGVQFKFCHIINLILKISNSSILVIFSLPGSSTKLGLLVQNKWPLT